MNHETEPKDSLGSCSEQPAKKDRLVQVSEEAELGKIVCLEDFEHRAKEKLSEPIFSFVYHGANEENTRRWNHAMIVEKYCLRPRILRDVSNIDLTKYIYGDKVSMPIGIAPTGLCKMYNQDGELAIVSAAKNLNTLMVLSQFSTISLEDVAQEAPICTKWQNVYFLRNKDCTSSLVNRAIRYGYRALVVTCDSPVLGQRRETLRNPIRLEEFKLKNLDHSPCEGSVKDHANLVLDSSVTWQNIADLKKTVGDTIRVIVKGLMTPEDAEEALKVGVDGIYVSNHGGRQLDCCQSTIEALPAIVQVVKKRCPVFVDGGFTTGTDVLKALALGADMVFLGRPILYSLAVGGQSGVSLALEMIRDELKTAMALCGCTKLSDITQDIVKDR